MAPGLAVELGPSAVAAANILDTAVDVSGVVGQQAVV